MPKKKKAPGRPSGSQNIKSSVLRDEFLRQQRVSEGFNKVLDELVAAGHYKSKSDALHDALQILAMRKLPATFYWITKIQ